MLSWQLFFDPSDVGIREPAPWSDAPETAVELGVRRPNGRTMAGIDYLATTGSEVHAWSDVLPDPVQADERGGRVPFLIHHGQRQLPPPDRFGPLLGRALREAAVGLVEPAMTEEIGSDFRAVQMPTLAVVRPGPRVASHLDGQHYTLLVMRAAAALGRYGVPVEDAGDQTPLMAQQLLRDAPGYLLDWDYNLFASMVVPRNRSGSQQTAEEVRRVQALTSRGRENLTPTWLLEPGAPLSELAATRRFGAGALSVVVTANAAVPKDGAPQAMAWLQSALNGGERGRRRALQEVAGARHVGAVALAHATLGAALRKTLPGRTRRAVEEVRDACRARLHEGVALPDGRLAESLAQLLVTYALHLTEAEDLLAAIDAVLGVAGCELPLLVLLGGHGPLLLPVPRVDSSWAELARAHVSAGYEGNLGDLWEADPDGLFAPDEGLAELVHALEPCGHDVDLTVLAAFTRWALADAHHGRVHGVRGGSAYITIDEPRLRAAGLERFYLLRESESDVLVRCDWSDGHRAALRLPRHATGWQSWADAPGGRLLAAYLVGAYRDSVVRLERPAFVEDEHPAPDTTRVTRGLEPQRRMRPVGYLPSVGGGHRRRGPRATDNGPPAPHAVAWYIRRLRTGYRTGPDALAAAEAVGIVVPTGYTFVGSHVWPRAADPRSAAAELRATAALSSLRAILQATAQADRTMGRSPNRDP
jgi:hypothetical protein